MFSLRLCHAAGDEESILIKKSLWGKEIQHIKFNFIFLYWNYLKIYKSISPGFMQIAQSNSIFSNNGFTCRSMSGNEYRIATI